MPPISEPSARGQKGASEVNLSSFPDRDNPLAWKRKVAEGKRGARELLTTLTDDEVGRYMSVAMDQVHIEERHKGLKVASAVLGLLVVIAAVAIGWHAHFGGRVLSGLGLGIAMVYWPWRALTFRKLWLKHFEAARTEQERRSQQTTNSTTKT